MTSADPEPRERVGRYRLLSRLGAGGMGEVYLAHDPLLDRHVAVKLLPVSTANEEEWRQRMLREARAAARLDHPNVCTLYEAGIDDDDGGIYLVMQYLDGRTVADWWREETRSVDDIVTIARGVARALEEAHRLGIVHRDMKPQNVMWTQRGIKVLDFGLARSAGESVDAEQITQSGVVSGTTAYMSPEQLRLEPLDGRSDVFSFGVMLYELFAGRRPFDRATVVDTIATLLHAPPPPLPSRGQRGLELEKLIMQMLEKSAENRPTAAQVLARLEEVTRVTDHAESTPTTRIAMSDVISASPLRSALSTSSVLHDAGQQKLYARGRHLLEKRAVPHVKLALDAFQEIIDLDPECAPAYAGLADCYLLLGFLQALPPGSTFPRARAAAMRAIALQDDRSDAHATLGYTAYIHDWDIAEAGRELRRAIEIDPGFATAHHWLGFVLCAQERFDEGRDALNHARDLDPLSTIFATAAAFPDVYQHRLDEAIRAYGEVLELQSSFAPAHYYRGLALQQAGRIEDALSDFERANALAPVKLESFPASIHVLALAGNIDEARVRMAALQADSASRFVPPLFFAIAHLALGEFDAAFAAIDAAVQQRGVRLSDLHLDRRFDALPDRERFSTILRTIGVFAR